jgi:zinc protease
LLRDRLKKVTTADVERVWARYFKPQNRTIGEFVPTAQPDRAPIPDAPEAKAVLATYTGGEAVQQGEAFDPTAENIEARVQRITLPNGALLVLMPKKTRAQQVKGSFLLRVGTLASLKGHAAVADLVGPLLERGTKTKSYAAFQNELEKNKSFASYFSAGQAVGVNLTTQRANLEAVLKLVEESLLTPTLDAAELEHLRSERLARLDQSKSEPQALGSIELSRALNPHPPDDIRATLPFDEQIKRLKAVKLDEVRASTNAFMERRRASSRWWATSTRRWWKLRSAPRTAPGRPRRSSSGPSTCTCRARAPRRRSRRPTRPTPSWPRG